MKQWLKYLFLCLYISSTTQLSELYKLPVFVSHFIEHSSGGSFLDEMSFFLVHHYGGHEKDADWDTDQQLPFMNMQQQHIDFVMLPNYEFQLSNSVSISSLVIQHYTQEENLYAHYLNAIWQPPKIS